jgi:hypothetical protein
LAAFVRWLLGPLPQLDAAPASARTFRRHSAWCWQVEPAVTVTGEIYDEVQLDGIYLSSHWCALIASHRGKVLAWQWCDREKTIAWRVLLQRLPPPQVVVCDGGPGLHAALNQDWPDTRVQRCLVHVQRNVRTQLTSRPRTDAGKALWGLAKTLTRIGSLDEATAWLGHLNDWHTLHGHLIKARTYRDQLRGAAVPAWVRPGQRWWYTHDRLRRAYRLLERLARDEHLFTYLVPDFAGLSISATTNSIEGGVNAGLRDLLRSHRGMPEHHQRRAIEWWLHAHAEAPTRPSTPPPATTAPPHSPLPNGLDGPPATTPDSPPKKASGTAEAGPDAHDTPNNRHTFWPITHKRTPNIRGGRVRLAHRSICSRLGRRTEWLKPDSGQSWRGTVKH